jgi:hypothetical protein
MMDQTDLATSARELEVAKGKTPDSNTVFKMTQGGKDN